MSDEKSDVLIIGAGIVGLAIGIAILEQSPSLQVRICEKESSLGRHASGRNSGVLHAGFYYSPDSLKARFCRDGNSELKTLCSRHEIPVNAVGKVVVARNEDEDSRLDDLYAKGIANGVDLHLLPADQLSKYEPLATTFNRFLWSPNTAISDSSLVLNAMRQDFLNLGGKIFTATSITLQESNGEIRANSFDSKLVVNAAGAQSDRIARSVGLAQNYAMLPFMGIYRSVDMHKLPLRTLVYPVPHHINPFLGVHLTLTIDGKVKIGPTAIPILGREQYSLLSGWSLQDIGQAGVAAKSLIRGEAHSISEILRTELPKLYPPALIKAASALVPTAKQVKGWKRKPPGIRAQLVDKRTGKLEQDFVVQNLNNSVHVLNAVSPGWTSALPFGRWIASEKVLPLL
jgi:L-2-hydroxyglutarate oxidase LhgO